MIKHGQVSSLDLQDQDEFDLVLALAEIVVDLTSCKSEKFFV